MQVESNRYPIIITKSELRTALRCTSYDQWRNKLMTDQVLSEILNVDRARFNLIRQFDTIQTRKLIEFFSLTVNDFSN